VDFSQTCPSAQIVLTGYSQGAQVTADVYQNMTQQHVAGVVFFGDPYFNSKDAIVDRPSMGGYKAGRNGALGARPLFGMSVPWASVVLSYCHMNDPVCQSPHDAVDLAQSRVSHHRGYERGDAQDAVRHFSALLALEGWGYALNTDNGTNTDGTGVFDAAICLKPDLVAVGRSWACQRDLNATTLPAASEIWCTARYANVIDHTYLAAIGSVPWNHGMSGGGTIGGLTGGAAQQIAESLQRPPWHLPTGVISCTFWLDGSRAAVRSVTLTG
jgi:hypothetical protein